MNEHLSLEDTYIRNIEQINALVDYVRRAGLNALNEYQQDKVLGITTRQGMMLAAVARLSRQQGGGVTLSSLARELHMSVSSASHLADTLEGLNLLQRSTHEDDRRSVCITLSPAGQQCASAARQGMLNAVNELTTHLTPEENALRLRMIDKLYRVAYPASP